MSNVHKTAVLLNQALPDCHESQSSFELCQISTKTRFHLNFDRLQLQSARICGAKKDCNLAILLPQPLLALARFLSWCFDALMSLYLEALLQSHQQGYKEGLDRADWMLEQTGFQDFINQYEGLYDKAFIAYLRERKANLEGQ